MNPGDITVICLVEVYKTMLHTKLLSSVASVKKILLIAMETRIRLQLLNNYGKGQEKNHSCSLFAYVQ